MRRVSRKVDPKIQRRHWVLTVQSAHLGLDENSSVDDFVNAMNEAWERVEKDGRVRYACGQLERGEATGRLHGQVYLEFDVSLRNAQVRKVVDSWAEPREGTRTQARDYCRKRDGRVLSLPDLGEWREERGDGNKTGPGPKMQALQMLVTDGMTPAQIAIEAPDVYFQFHAAINATYKALNADLNGDSFK